MDNINELKRFKKSFLLHSSRYNLYSKETLVKGSVKTHNAAVKALGKLEDKVIANPSLYSDLLSELLADNDPKVSLSASFICLAVNLHTDKAIEVLSYIGNNTPEISMICDFDIRGRITRFRKRQINSVPRNEVDEIADMMKNIESHTDSDIFDMIMKLQNIDECGHDGRTALIHASICNRSVLAKRLIELGADVNKKDCKGKTALHCSAIVANTEIVSLLIKYNANINAQDERGFTALDFAKGNFTETSKKEIEKLVELLISHGAKTKKEIFDN